MIDFLTTWIWFLESVCSSVFHFLTGSLLFSIPCSSFSSFLPTFSPPPTSTEVERSGVWVHCRKVPHTESGVWIHSINLPHAKGPSCKGAKPSRDSMAGFFRARMESDDKNLGHGAQQDLRKDTSVAYLVDQKWFPDVLAWTLTSSSSYVQGLKPTVQTARFILKLGTLESHESLMTSNIPMMEVPAQLFQVLPHPTCLDTKPPTKRPRPMEIMYPPVALTKWHQWESLFCFPLVWSWRKSHIVIFHSFDFG